MAAFGVQLALHERPRITACEDLAHRCHRSKELTKRLLDIRAVGFGERSHSIGDRTARRSDDRPGGRYLVDIPLRGAAVSNLESSSPSTESGQLRGATSVKALCPKPLPPIRPVRVADAVKPGLAIWACLHPRSTPYDPADSLIAEFFPSQSLIRLGLAPPKPVLGVHIADALEGA